MYVGLKQPRGDGERCVTPARAVAKETTNNWKSNETVWFKPFKEVQFDQSNQSVGTLPFWFPALFLFIGFPLLLEITERNRKR